MIKHVAFCQQIVILGTPKRQDQFLAADGWVIEEHAQGVALSHPGAQNVAPVPMFGVVGIGYCISGRGDDGDGSDLGSEGATRSEGGSSGGLAEDVAGERADAEPERAGGGGPEAHGVASPATEGDGGGVDPGGASLAAKQAEGAATRTPLTTREAEKIAGRVFGKGRKR